jgi:hypothetical protein
LLGVVASYLASTNASCGVPISVIRDSGLAQLAGGWHEGVLQVGRKPQAGIPLTAFQETLRGRFSERFPTAPFSFEPGDIVSIRS